MIKLNGKSWQNLGQCSSEGLPKNEFKSYRNYGQRLSSHNPKLSRDIEAHPVTTRSRSKSPISITTRNKSKSQVPEIITTRSKSAPAPKNENILMENVVPKQFNEIY